jgi:hypothetical protein
MLNDASNMVRDGTRNSSATAVWIPILNAYSTPAFKDVDPHCLAVNDDSRAARGRALRRQGPQLIEEEIVERIGPVLIDADHDLAPQEVLRRLHWPAAALLLQETPVALRFATSVSLTVLARRWVYNTCPRDAFCGYPSAHPHKSKQCRHTQRTADPHPHLDTAVTGRG